MIRRTNKEPITRRSLFAMFIAAPFAKLLPKPRRIGVTNGSGETKILEPYDGHPIVEGEFIGRARSGRLVGDSSFVNRSSKNWAKHNEECWLAQSSSPEESAWFAEHFDKLWNLVSPRYRRDSQFPLF